MSKITRSDLRSTAKVILTGAVVLELILDAIALAAIIIERFKGNSLRASMLHVCSAYAEFWKKVFMKVSGFFNWMLMKISNLR